MSMRAPESLRRYLGAIESLTGAASVALLTVTNPRSATGAVLIHEGASEPVAELAELSGALTFAQENPVAGREVTVIGAADAQDRLIGIPVRALKLQRSHVPERRSLQHKGLQPEGTVWLGLRFENRVPEALRDSGELAKDNVLATVLLGSAILILEVVELVTAFQDDVTRLPGRVELQALLNTAVHGALDRTVGLLLVNPDDFARLNHRFGRDEGDEALREIAERLSHCLRASDAIFRYGGAIFALVLPDINPTGLAAVIDKLQKGLNGSLYLEGAAALTFSIGAALFDPEGEFSELSAEDLLRRADSALNGAKLAGGAHSVIWGDGTEVISQADPLSGVFTANVEKDYRNMLLLWDSIDIVSARSEKQVIADEFVTRVARALDVARVGIFEFDGDSLVQLAARQLAQDGGYEAAEDIALSWHERESKMVLELPQRLRTERVRLDDGATSYFVPAVLEGRCLACLYFHDASGAEKVDSSDLVFMYAMARQIAAALDRASLAEQWVRQKELESRQLKVELKELRNALQHSQLIYQSGGMHEVVEVLRRVGPTDATVLIIGESGTGKEMLAQTLHSFSDRRDRPLITVDCSAIAQSLIDSELFGHVKGAYTGAEGGSTGRIAEADGGTVFLDEIGELPLEVQAKLLRFVQEKEITPVGSARSRKVDVRIVAATNRDLEAEVRAGQFRGDLYYRLRVVSVFAPPLRERGEDVLTLTSYFLEKFATQYRQPLKHLTASAEQELLEYAWPGNVRELQNCIMRAVLMTESVELDVADLALDARFSPEPLYERPMEIVVEPASAGPATTPQGDIRSRLGAEVDRALVEDSADLPPLGSWLAEDLVLAAHDTASGTGRHAAERLGLAETTFRRRLQNVRKAESRGTLARSESWAKVRDDLREQLENDGKGTIADDLRELLLQLVYDRVGEDARRGSELMGVTPPTYKRWVERSGIERN